MWFETADCSSVADNLVSVADNLGLEPALVANNVVSKWRCLQFRVFLFAVRYNYRATGD